TSTTSGYAYSSSGRMLSSHNSTTSTAADGKSGNSRYSTTIYAADGTSETSGRIVSWSKKKEKKIFGSDPTRTSYSGTNFWEKRDASGDLVAGERTTSFWGHKYHSSADRVEKYENGEWRETQAEEIEDDRGWLQIACDIVESILQDPGTLMEIVMGIILTAVGCPTWVMTLMNLAKKVMDGEKLGWGDLLSVLPALGKTLGKISGWLKGLADTWVGTAWNAVKSWAGGLWEGAKSAYSAVNSVVSMGGVVETAVALGGVIWQGVQLVGALVSRAYNYVANSWVGKVVGKWWGNKTAAFFGSGAAIGWKKAILKALVTKVLAPALYMRYADDDDSDLTAALKDFAIKFVLATINAFIDDIDIKEGDTSAVKDAFMSGARFAMFTSGVVLDALVDAGIKELKEKALGGRKVTRNSAGELVYKDSRQVRYEPGEHGKRTEEYTEKVSGAKKQMLIALDTVGQWIKEIGGVAMQPLVMAAKLGVPLSISLIWDPAPVNKAIETAVLKNIGGLNLTAIVEELGKLGLTAEQITTMLKEEQITTVTEKPHSYQVFNELSVLYMQVIPAMKKADSAIKTAAADVKKIGADESLKKGMVAARVSFEGAKIAILKGEYTTALNLAKKAGGHAQLCSTWVAFGEQTAKSAAITAVAVPERANVSKNKLGDGTIDFGGESKENRFEVEIRTSDGSKTFAFLRSQVLLGPSGRLEFAPEVEARLSKELEISLGENSTFCLTKTASGDNKIEAVSDIFKTLQVAEVKSNKPPTELSVSKRIEPAGQPEGPEITQLKLTFAELAAIIEFAEENPALMAGLRALTGEDESVFARVVDITIIRAGPDGTAVLEIKGLEPGQIALLKQQAGTENVSIIVNDREPSSVIVAVTSETAQVSRLSQASFNAAAPALLSSGKPMTLGAFLAIAGYQEAAPNLISGISAADGAGIPVTLIRAGSVTMLKMENLDSGQIDLISGTLSETKTVRLVTGSADGELFSAIAVMAPEGVSPEAAKVIAPYVDYDLTARGAVGDAALCQIQAAGGKVMNILVPREFQAFFEGMENVEVKDGQLRMKTANATPAALAFLGAIGVNLAGADVTNLVIVLDISAPAAVVLPAGYENAGIEIKQPAFGQIIVKLTGLDAGQIEEIKARAAGDKNVNVAFGAGDTLIIGNIGFNMIQESGEASVAILEVNNLEPGQTGPLTRTLKQMLGTENIYLITGGENPSSAIVIIAPGSSGDTIELGKFSPGVIEALALYADFNFVMPGDAEDIVLWRVDTGAGVFDILMPQAARAFFTGGVKIEDGRLIMEMVTDVVDPAVLAGFKSIGANLVTKEGGRTGGIALKILAPKLAGEMFTGLKEKRELLNELKKTVGTVGFLDLSGNEKDIVVVTAKTREGAIIAAVPAALAHCGFIIFKDKQEAAEALGENSGIDLSKYPENTPVVLASTKKDGPVFFIRTAENLTVTPPETAGSNLIDTYPGLRKVMDTINTFGTNGDNNASIEAIEAFITGAIKTARTGPAASSDASIDALANAAYTLNENLGKFVQAGDVFGVEARALITTSLNFLRVEAFGKDLSVPAGYALIHVTAGLIENLAGFKGDFADWAKKQIEGNFNKVIDFLKTAPKEMNKGNMQFFIAAVNGLGKMTVALIENFDKFNLETQGWAMGLIKQSFDTVTELLTFENVISAIDKGCVDFAVACVNNLGKMTVALIKNFGDFGKFAGEAWELIKQSFGTVRNLLSKESITAMLTGDRIKNGSVGFLVAAVKNLKEMTSALIKNIDKFEGKFEVAAMEEIKQSFACLTKIIDPKNIVTILEKGKNGETAALVVSALEALGELSTVIVENLVKITDEKTKEQMLGFVKDSLTAMAEIAGDEKFAEILAATGGTACVTANLVSMARIVSALTAAVGKGTLDDIRMWDMLSSSGTLNAAVKMINAAGTVGENNKFTASEKGMVMAAAFVILEGALVADVNAVGVGGINKLIEGIRGLASTMPDGIGKEDVESFLKGGADTVQARKDLKEKLTKLNEILAPLIKTTAELNEIIGMDNYEVSFAYALDEKTGQLSLTVTLAIPAKVLRGALDDICGVLNITSAKKRHNIKAYLDGSSDKDSSDADGIRFQSTDGTTFTCGVQDFKKVVTGDEIVPFAGSEKLEEICKSLRVGSPREASFKLRWQDGTVIGFEIYKGTADKGAAKKIGIASINADGSVSLIARGDKWDSKLMGGFRTAGEIKAYYAARFGVEARDIRFDENTGDCFIYTAEENVLKTTLGRGLLDRKYATGKFVSTGALEIALRLDGSATLLRDMKLVTKKSGEKISVLAGGIIQLAASSSSFDISYARLRVHKIYAPEEIYAPLSAGKGEAGTSAVNVTHIKHDKGGLYLEGGEMMIQNNKFIAQENQIFIFDKSAKQSGASITIAGKLITSVAAVMWKDGQTCDAVKYTQAGLIRLAGINAMMPEGVTGYKVFQHLDGDNKGDYVVFADAVTFTDTISGAKQTVTEKMVLMGDDLTNMESGLFACADGKMMKVSIVKGEINAGYWAKPTETDIKGLTNAKAGKLIAGTAGISNYVVFADAATSTDTIKGAKQTVTEKMVLMGDDLKNMRSNPITHADGKVMAVSIVNGELIFARWELTKVYDEKTKITRTYEGNKLVLTEKGIEVKGEKGKLVVVSGWEEIYTYEKIDNSDEERISRVVKNYTNGDVETTVYRYGDISNGADYLTVDTMVQRSEKEVSGKISLTGVSEKIFSFIDSLDSIGEYSAGNRMVFTAEKDYANWQLKQDASCISRSYQDVYIRPDGTLFTVKAGEGEHVLGRETTYKEGAIVEINITDADGQFTRILASKENGKVMPVFDGHGKLQNASIIEGNRKTIYSKGKVVSQIFSAGKDEIVGKPSETDEKTWNYTRQSDNAKVYPVGNGGLFLANGESETVRASELLAFLKGDDTTAKITGEDRDVTITLNADANGISFSSSRIIEFTTKEFMGVKLSEIEGSDTAIMNGHIMTDGKIEYDISPVLEESLLIKAGLIEKLDGIVWGGASYAGKILCVRKDGDLYAYKHAVVIDAKTGTELEIKKTSRVSGNDGIDVIATVIKGSVDLGKTLRIFEQTGQPGPGGEQSTAHLKKDEEGNILALKNSVIMIRYDKTEDSVVAGVSENTLLVVNESVENLSAKNSILIAGKEVMSGKWLVRDGKAHIAPVVGNTGKYIDSLVKINEVAGGEDNIEIIGQFTVVKEGEELRIKGEYFDIEGNALGEKHEGATKTENGVLYEVVRLPSADKGISQYALVNKAAFTGMLEKMKVDNLELKIEVDKNTSFTRIEGNLYSINVTKDGYNLTGTVRASTVLDEETGQNQYHIESFEDVTVTIHGTYEVAANTDADGNVTATLVVEGRESAPVKIKIKNNEYTTGFTAKVSGEFKFGEYILDSGSLVNYTADKGWSFGNGAKGTYCPEKQPAGFANLDIEKAEWEMLDEDGEYKKGITFKFEVQEGRLFLTPLRDIRMTSKPGEKLEETVTIYKEYEYKDKRIISSLTINDKNQLVLLDGVTRRHVLDKKGASGGEAPVRSEITDIIISTDSLGNTWKDGLVEVVNMRDTVGKVTIGDIAAGQHADFNGYRFTEKNEGLVFEYISVKEGGGRQYVLTGDNNKKDGRNVQLLKYNGMDIRGEDARVFADLEVNKAGHTVTEIEGTPFIMTDNAYGIKVSLLSRQELDVIKAYITKEGLKYDKTELSKYIKVPAGENIPGIGESFKLTCNVAGQKQLLEFTLSDDGFLAPTADTIMTIRAICFFEGIEGQAKKAFIEKFDALIKKSGANMKDAGSMAKFLKSAEFKKYIADPKNEQILKSGQSVYYIAADAESRFVLDKDNNLVLVKGAKVGVWGHDRLDGEGSGTTTIVLDGSKTNL
ncbi:MAG: hypothetical protein KKG95_00685, partial [Candidatus Omnitrophica bacterium]|nr:hypothetical protein [Candidatus Omnitrophota bacterium]